MCSQNPETSSQKAAAHKEISGGVKVVGERDMKKKIVHIKTCPSNLKLGYVQAREVKKMTKVC